MKKQLAMAAALLLAIGLSACGNGSSSQGGGSNNTVSGGDAEKLVDQKCSACHGNNLEGDVGPNLQHIGSKLSEKQILHVIENGKGDMPAGLLKGSDAKKVAKWLSEKK
ncbi:cytochrome c-551 [Weizmannia acidilactici]|uniref:Cytochrome c-551 n=1 Tax=Weizmannia acidilactici TaxID=2607726 RepID=A0A5J4J1J1_9BACI|nr:cytochrome c [Weizmannia acidilactici]GER65990.1 cytochrome c-551 [Weizmannia acidilactici]GER68796.1 cytochrome c-551 [Weizmannia acidilactici]GER72919.1 cytochrome c-551 [Weizmannia acidilactici]